MRNLVRPIHDREALANDLAARMASGALPSLVGIVRSGIPTNPAEPATDGPVLDRDFDLVSAIYEERIPGANVLTMDGAQPGLQASRSTRDAASRDCLIPREGQFDNC
jgi:hypothetical protein